MTATIPFVDDGGLVQSLRRITGVVLAETEALSRFAHVDLEANARTKAQALLDLTRRMRMRGPAPSGAGLADALDAFRRALAENESVIRVHLDAARSVSALVMQAMQRADSDGAYAAPRRLAR